MIERSERARRLKAAYVEGRGHWIEEFEGLLAFAPEFLEAHLARVWSSRATT